MSDLPTSELMARRLVIVVAALVLVAVVVVGLVQAADDGGSQGATRGSPTPAEAQRALAGAPPELAALHRQANRLLPAGADASRRACARCAGTRSW